MTLDYVDGFEHQYEDPTAFDGTHGLWTVLTNATAITFPAGRTGQSMKFVQDGVTATRAATSDTPTSQQRTASFWFRIPSAPSVTSTLWQGAPSGGGSLCRFQVNTSGQILGQCTNAGTPQTGPVVSDNAWHRLDFWLDSSGTTYTLKWRVDGTPQTDATQAGLSANNLVRLIFSSSDTFHTLTVEFDDFVSGDNGATDYPINNGGDYTVLFLSPTSDGTHNAGVNVIEDQAGTDIVSPNAFPLLDEIPPTNTDYIRQVAIGAGNYAEVNFADTAETNILAVCGLLVGGSAQASSPNGTARIVDSGGTTLVNLFSGDMGGGSLTDRVVNLKIPDPGGDGWTQADLNGIKLRVGFSSNASGSVTPRWGGALVQYARAAAVGGGGTTLDPFGMSGFFGG
jgi:hypothetical protein